MAYRTLKYMKKELPEGFVKVDKKTIQSRLSPILQELIELADREGIKLYLIFGSLLGYERHEKSFIPWDDDIDVTVSYWDRDKLARAIEKHKKLPINSLKRRVDRDWPGLSFSSDKYDVVGNSYFEKGIFTRYSIDIFEYANFSNKNDHKKIKRIVGCLFMKKSTGGGLQRLVRILMLPIPKKLLVKLLHKREKKLIKKGGAYEWTIIDDVKKSWHTTFDGSDKKGKFENIEIFLPHDSDVFLKSRYSDWKKVPSEKSINWNTHFYGERKNS